MVMPAFDTEVLTINCTLSFSLLQMSLHLTFFMLCKMLVPSLAHLGSGSLTANHDREIYDDLCSAWRTRPSCQRWIDTTQGLTDAQNSIIFLVPNPATTHEQIPVAMMWVPRQKKTEM